VSNIHAGTGALNIIPGTVVVDFNFRFATASTVEGLEDRVRAVLARHGLDFELDWVLGGKPFLTPRGRLVEAMARAVRQVSGVSPELATTGGTSDGRFIADICPEVVEFGPVNRTIHQVNEAVAIDELEPLTEIYRLVCADLLGLP
jgi:succinyl-diaminopimelate desuccinylase